MELTSSRFQGDEAVNQVLHLDRSCRKRQFYAECEMIEVNFYKAILKFITYTSP